MATALQTAARSTTLRFDCSLNGTSGSRTHRSPRFELGRCAGLRTVPFPLPVDHSAPPMGFEPMASTLTGWRALQAAPRGRSPKPYFQRRHAVIKRKSPMLLTPGLETPRGVHDRPGINSDGDRANSPNARRIASYPDHVASARRSLFPRSEARTFVTSYI
jgi:hypothetical protein